MSDKYSKGRNKAEDIIRGKYFAYRTVKILITLVHI